MESYCFLIGVLLVKFILYTYNTTTNLEKCNCFVNNLYIVHIEEVEMLDYKIGSITMTNIMVSAT